MAIGSFETSDVNIAATRCNNAEDRNAQYPRRLVLKSHIVVYLRDYLMAPFECRKYRPPLRETHSHRTAVGISSTLRSLCVLNDTVCMQDLLLKCAKNGSSNIYMIEVMWRQRSWFYLWSIHVMFMETEVALGQAFFPDYLCFPVVAFLTVLRHRWH
jgi:hypothetical protein